MVGLSTQLQYLKLPQNIEYMLTGYLVQGPTYKRLALPSTMEALRCLEPWSYLTVSVYSGTYLVSLLARQARTPNLLREFPSVPFQTHVFQATELLAMYCTSVLHRILVG